jgi:hypothetical protein
MTIPGFVMIEHCIDKKSMYIAADQNTRTYDRVPLHGPPLVI